MPVLWAPRAAAALRVLVWLTPSTYEVEWGGRVEPVTVPDPQRWRGRIRASVSADADRVFEVVGLLDDLGFSTHLTHAHGRWQVELHRPKAPTVALLHRVVALFERTFPGRDAVTIVIDVGGRSYRLGRRAAAKRTGLSPGETTPESGL